MHQIWSFMAITILTLGFNSVHARPVNLTVENLSEGLSPEHTVGVINLGPPHKTLNSFGPLIGHALSMVPSHILNEIKGFLKPSLSRPHFHFSPLKARAWRRIGLDPTGGLFILFDQRFYPNNKVPILLFRLADGTRLLNAIKAVFPQARVVKAAGGVTTIETGALGRIQLGKKGPLHALLLQGKDVNSDLGRSHFMAFLTENSTGLPRVAIQSILLPKKDLGRRIGWFFRPWPKRATTTRRDQESATGMAHFWSRWVFAGTLDDSGVLKIQVGGGRHIHEFFRDFLKANGKTPFGVQYLKPGWIQAKLSLNLSQVFESTSGLLAPSTPHISSQILRVKRLLPTTMGFSYGQVKKAFDGMAMLGVKAPANGRTTHPKGFGAFLLLGIDDTHAADGIMDTLGRLRIRGRESVSINRSQARGYQWHFGSLQPTLLRLDRTLIIALNESSLISARNTYSKRQTPWIGVAPPGAGQHAVLGVGGDLRALLPLLFGQRGSKGDHDTLSKAIMAITGNAHGPGERFGIIAGFNNGLNLLSSGQALPRLLTMIALVSYIEAVRTYIRIVESAELIPATKQLMDRSTTYYDRRMLDSQGKIKAVGFPRSAPLTPGNPTKYMCKDGKPISYHPTPATFSSSAWKALNFRVDTPMRYAYQYTSTGHGPGAAFVVRAVADLDCDGQLSIYERRGYIHKSGHLSVGPGEFK